MPKCYYCNKNSANNPKHYYEHEIFLVTSRNTPVSFSSITQKIQIERCYHCEKKHDEAFKVWLAFVLLFNIIIVLIVFKRNQWHPDRSSILIAVILGFIGGTIVTYPIKFIYEMIRKVHFESDISSHPRIAELMRKGWLLDKPDPSGGSVDESYNKYQETIKNGEGIY